MRILLDASLAIVFIVVMPSFYPKNRGKNREFVSIARCISIKGVNRRVVLVILYMVWYSTFFARLRRLRRPLCAFRPSFCLFCLSQSALRLLLRFGYFAAPSSSAAATAVSVPPTSFIFSPACATRRFFEPSRLARPWLNSDNGFDDAGDLPPPLRRPLLLMPAALPISADALRSDWPRDDDDCCACSMAVGEPIIRHDIDNHSSGYRCQNNSPNDKYVSENIRI